MWSISTHHPPSSSLTALTFYTHYYSQSHLPILNHPQFSLLNTTNQTSNCTSMAAPIAVPCSSRPLRLHRIPFLGQKPTSTTSQFPFLYRNVEMGVRGKRTPTLTICFVGPNNKFETQSVENNNSGSSSSSNNNSNSNSNNSRPSGEDNLPLPEPVPVVVVNRNLEVEKKLKRKKSERFTYLVAAIMSTFGITSMAVLAVYYRFSWQMEGGEIPYVEMFGTFALSVGAAVGMEYWARWAHEALWHASLWHMHESHHKPREGPFELNDVFAIINAVPAIALLNYGFFHKGIVPGLCFGAGLGITVFGMAYMFVHDGLVHKRFQVGPIANVPYLRRVAAAHQLHHTEKFNGVPYGLFLGPKELEEVGGMEELEKEIQRRIKLYNNK